MWREEGPMKHPEEHGNPRQTTRTVIKYALLNLPAAALVAAVMLYLEAQRGLPGWLLWVVIVAWVIKDILLFPLVRRAYEDIPDNKGMKGTTGIAQERLAPAGYIWIHGELWRARLVYDDGVVEKGEAVRVRDIRGLTLLVEPEKGRLRRSLKEPEI
jgi:membrane protein implicated in regulation of membrane protease activity